jgi:hypothetical protein
MMQPAKVIGEAVGDNAVIRAGIKYVIAGE